MGRFSKKQQYVFATHWKFLPTPINLKRSKMRKWIIAKKYEAQWHEQKWVLTITVVSRDLSGGQENWQSLLFGKCNGNWENASKPEHTLNSWEQAICNSERVNPGLKSLTKSQKRKHSSGHSKWLYPALTKLHSQSPSLTVHLQGMKFF